MNHLALPHRSRRFGWLTALLLALLLLTLWPLTLLADDPLTSSSAANQPPVVGRHMKLYDVVKGGLPHFQGFIFFSDPGTHSVFSNGVTHLETLDNNDIQAGFIRQDQTLKRTDGFTIRFHAQLIFEHHISDDRAGFSVIALGSDKKGIEIGFWENEIWAQEGGTAPDLFVHAEGAAFDTTAALHPYELTILGDTYALAVTDTFILSGTVRDYTAFTGFPDVYETPNFIFFGDNTTSAQANVRLGTISLIDGTAPATRTVSVTQTLAIDDLGVLDEDANGQDEVLTLSVTNGVLTLTTNLPDGLSNTQVSGNGSSTVVLTGSIGRMNSTLHQTSALVYQANADFTGVDTLAVTLNDRGGSGGGNLTGTQTIPIIVTGGDDTPKYSIFLPLIVKG